MTRTHNGGLQFSWRAMRWCVSLGTLLGVFGSLLLPSGLRAQVSTTAQFATITTDTGAFAPGYQQFANYTAPALCVADVQRLRARLQRTLDVQLGQDSLRLMPLQDSQPVQVTRLARQCGSRFTLANTQVKQLADLFILTLLEQNDTLAAAAVVKFLNISPSATLRDHNELLILGSYLHDLDMSVTDAAQPARLTAATALVSQIDARGSATLSHRMRAHVLLLHCWQRSRNAAMARAEAEQLITLANQAFKTSTEKTDSLKQFLNEGYSELMTQTFLTTPESLLSVGNRWLADMKRGDAKSFASISDTALQYVRTLDSIPLCASIACDIHGRTHTGGLALSREGLRLLGALPGGARDDSAPLVRIPTSVVFATNGEVLSPTPAIPELGKVNLIIGEDVDLGDSPIVVDHLRRLIEQYGPQGLVVTIVHNTKGEKLHIGWFRDDAEALSPAAEADSLRWYYQTYRQLPVQVAVQERALQFLPLPDGRRIPDTLFVHSTRILGEFSLDNSGHSLSNGYNNVLVTGRDGKVLLYCRPSTSVLGTYNGFDEFVDPGIIEAMVKYALTRATAGSSQAER